MDYSNSQRPRLTTKAKYTYLVGGLRVSIICSALRNASTVGGWGAIVLLAKKNNASSRLEIEKKHSGHPASG